MKGWRMKSFSRKLIEEKKHCNHCVFVDFHPWNKIKKLMILRSLVFWILCTAPQRKVLVFAEQNWQSIIPFLRRGTPSTSSSSRCWRLENTMIKIFWGQVEQQNYDDSMTILVTSMRAMVAIWDKLKRSNPLIHPEIQMMLSYSKLHGSWPLGPPLSCLGPKSPPKSMLRVGFKIPTV